MNFIKRFFSSPEPEPEMDILAEIAEFYPELYEKFQQDIAKEFIQFTINSSY